jgi:hypothetical protein
MRDAQQHITGMEFAFGNLSYPIDIYRVNWPVAKLPGISYDQILILFYSIPKFRGKKCL